MTRTTTRRSTTHLEFSCTTTASPRCQGCSDPSASQVWMTRFSVSTIRTCSTKTLSNHPTTTVAAKAVGVLPALRGRSTALLCACDAEPWGRSCRVGRQECDGLGRQRRAEGCVLVRAPGSCVLPTAVRAISSAATPLHHRRAESTKVMTAPSEVRRYDTMGYSSRCVAAENCKGPLLRVPWPMNHLRYRSGLAGRWCFIRGPTFNLPITNA